MVGYRVDNIIRRVRCPGNRLAEFLNGTCGKPIAVHRWRLQKVLSKNVKKAEPSRRRAQLFIVSGLAVLLRLLARRLALG